MSEISNYPRRSIEVANANREVVHSRRWLGGFAIANALFFGPIIGVVIVQNVLYSVPYTSILNPWQYAIYGAILNIGFLTMPVIRLARNTGRCVRWGIGRAVLIAMFSLAYIGFIPIAFLYFKSRKHVALGAEDALPHPAFTSTQ